MKFGRARILLVYVAVILLYVIVMVAFIASIPAIATALPQSVGPVAIPLLLFSLMYAVFRLSSVVVPDIAARLGGHGGGAGTEFTGLGWPDAELRPGGILIVSYPFEYSAAFPGPFFIPLSRITAVFASFDVAVVLDGKEVIFLPSKLRDALQEFAAAHALNAPKVSETWSILAEPYIDQPYSEEDAARDRRLLEACGVTEQEQEQWRAHIRGTMVTCTLLTMEWVNYTTQDVLRAFAVGNPMKFSEQFYWQVMEIALRQYRLSENAEPGSSDRPSALPANT